MTIKRAYSLGIQKKIVSDRPHISLLEEDNVRQGFFEREQFDSILRKHLPEWRSTCGRLRLYNRMATRVKSSALQWRQVDFEAGNVRLEPGTTKNREARQFPFTSELRAILEGQKAKARRPGEGRHDLPLGIFPLLLQEERQTVNIQRKASRRISSTHGKPPAQTQDFPADSCTTSGAPL